MASTKAMSPLRTVLAHSGPCRFPLHIPRRYFSITPIFAAPHPSTATPSSSSARQSHSVAQPSEPTAYEDVPAPPYISPATSSKLSSTSPLQPPSTSPKPVQSSDTANTGPSLSSGPIPIEMSPSMSAKGKSKETAPARGSRGSSLKAQKSAITMTTSALDHLRSLISSPTEPKLLRIGVKSRGCAGMAYHLDYVSPPGGKFDEVVEQDGVKVLIDSKALFSIIGSRMDWRDNRLSAGFVFDNPNVVDTCGCGESFNIR